jgi:hypothetical protein
MKIGTNAQFQPIQRHSKNVYFACVRDDFKLLQTIKLGIYDSVCCRENFVWLNLHR